MINFFMECLPKYRLFTVFHAASPDHLLRALALLNGSLLAVFISVQSYAESFYPFNHIENSVYEPDLSGSDQEIDNVGTVDIGGNFITGSIDTYCVSLGTCEAPDNADAFSFTVPEGLVVDDVTLTVHSFSSLLDFPQGKVSLLDSETSFIYSQKQKLMASDGANNDRFGRHTALDGDTAFIGAHRDDDNVKNSGSAYVFTRSDGQWSEQQKLTASDGGKNDNFGQHIALDGDTAIIGADDFNDNISGSAYIFIRHDGVWVEQQILKPSDGDANDRFGSDLTLDGDTAIIGAYTDVDDEIRSGSAYIFTRTEGVWSQQQKLTASDAEDDDYFGRYMALDGDTVIISAYRDDDKGRTSGSAYIFTRGANGEWIEQQKLMASDGAKNDRFGYRIALQDDTAVIGAWGDNDSGNNSGSAYIFTRNSNGYWTEQQKLTASDGSKKDNFGRQIAIDGDRVIIGAYRDDDKGDASGSAYIFTRNNGEWSKQQKLIANDGAENGRFGADLALDSGTAMVGSHRDQNSKGSVYIFTLPTIDNDESDTSGVKTFRGYEIIDLLNLSDENPLLAGTYALEMRSLGGLDDPNNDGISFHYSLRINAVSDTYHSELPQAPAVPGSFDHEMLDYCTKEAYASCAGVDWSGHDLSGLDLTGIDLRGANLSGANLSGAIMSSASLIGAFFDRANLSDVDLSASNLASSYLYNADMTDTELSDADLTDAFQGADLHVFSNGDQTDADDINENYQSLIKRINALESAVGGMGITGEKGIKGITGPHGNKGATGDRPDWASGLPSCQPGEAFIFNAAGGINCKLLSLDPDPNIILK